MNPSVVNQHIEAGTDSQHLGHRRLPDFRSLYVKRDDPTTRSMGAGQLLRVCALLLALPVATAAQPLGDHHQHLFSPTLAPLISQQPITAADLIRHLDAAGIRAFAAA